MRGTALSSDAAASGFVVLLLTVPVIQGQNDWGVNYSPTQICAPEGSTVVMSSIYTYPSTVKNVTEKFWFRTESNGVYSDLESVPEYSGRVVYHCENKKCTLKIKNLTKRDSGVYKFRFTTDVSGGRYTGLPGVTLSVTDLQIQVNVRSTANQEQTGLRCHSSCQVPNRRLYVWYKNEQVQSREQGTDFYQHSVGPEDKYRCALNGYENFRSPPVYAPKLPSVSVSPSAEIVEGSSVNLTCSSDANPAAKYTWYKVKDRKRVGEQPQFVFSSIQPSDSGDYYCEAVNAMGRKTSGRISLDVKYAPKLPSVSVSPSAEIVEGSSVNLTCSSDANPAANYAWYKVNNSNPLNTTQPSRQLILRHIQPSESGEYYCVAVNRRGEKMSGLIPVDVKYAPKLPSVSVSPSAEIVEGSSVTLTCSSDANPAAKLTWSNKNGNVNSSPNGSLSFNSIHSSDSGAYYCTAENKLGTQTTSTSIAVKYAPKLPSVSLSPSAEIVEGSSVNLTCNSDATPAANYTWYKVNNSNPLSERPQLILRSIQPSNSGEYYCEAVNTMGMKTSGLISIDVKYAPKLPSVSVSPSAEIVEGSSVTLTCSSDANPAANYTWYKEDEDSPKASGQIFTITDLRLEHSGNYSCEAQNTRGRQKSTLNLTVVQVFPKAWKSAIIATTSAFLLAVILLSAFLLIRKKRSSKQSSERGERPDYSDQPQPISNQLEEEEELHYASVRFLKTQTDPIYCNVKIAEHSRFKPEEEDHVEYSVVKFNSFAPRFKPEEEDHVEYSAVKFNSFAPRTGNQETEEDPAALYSTVNKTLRVSQ